MDITDAFWAARGREARIAFDIAERELEEYAQRERLLLTQMRALQDEMSLLSASGASPSKALAAPSEDVVEIRRQLDEAVCTRDELSAKLAAAEVTREVDVQKTAAFWLNKLSQTRDAGAVSDAVDPAVGLQTELEAVRSALTAEEAAHERDVQKVGAYWIARLTRAHEELENLRGSAAPPATPPATPPAMPPTTMAAAPPIPPENEDQSAKDRALIARLEEELFELESDYDALTDRIEVQSETIMMASARLDDVADALEAQVLKAEVQLQKASAFWVHRLKAAKAESAAELAQARQMASAQQSLAEERLAALSSAAAAAPAVAAPVGTAAEAELAQLREVVSEQASLLASQARLAEVNLQRTAAFWVSRDREQAALLKASEARVAALGAELEARSERAERELQATAAFWIRREQQARVRPAD